MRNPNRRNPAQDLLDKYGIASPPCGVSYPPGWVPLIEALLKDLLALGWDKDCQQVKEKFGGLRFYVGEETPEIRQRISLAESESFEVCPVCGAPGSTKNGVWEFVACDTRHKRPIRGRAGTET